MHIRVSNNQRRECEANPIRMRKGYGQGLQCYEQWDNPYLTHEPYKEPLIDLFRQPGPEEELEDEKNARWDGKQVGVECGEPKGFESKRKIARFWCLRVPCQRCFDSWNEE